MVALRKLFVLAVVASLTGCASDGMARLSDDNALNADSDYMYAVESIARHKGVGLVWIHPPREEGVDYSRAAAYR